MAKISTNAEINSIRVKEQGSAPGTPAAGYVQVYAKSDGKLYIKDDAGTESDLTGGGSAGVDESGWVASGETWTYASADDPTFTLTISGDKTTKYSAGMRVKLTQTTVRYFIITKVAYSDPDTTLTLYGGTDYDLDNAAITSPNYSVVKAPAGFPLDPIKWTVIVTDTTIRTQASPIANTWYNTGSLSISIPVGVWRVKYQTGIRSDKATADTTQDVRITLSTANNSESDIGFTARVTGHLIAGLQSDVSREKPLNLASKTTYYLNIMTASTGLSNIHIRSDDSQLRLTAECAYL